MSFIHDFQDFARQNPWGVVNFVDDTTGGRYAWIGAPLVGYEAANAPRGERSPVIAGGAASLASASFLGSASSLAMRALMPTAGPIGWLTVGLAGMIVGAQASNGVRFLVSRGMRTLKDYERYTRRLEMGGWYRDSTTTKSWRAGALQDMSGALGNARAYLGNEGAIFHR